MILDALEALEAGSPRGNRRIVIEHFGVSTAAQSDRIAKLGALVSANPYYFYSMADEYAIGNLGPERADALVRLGSLRANHVRFGLHSDFTMAPIDPLLLAWIAANRITADGKLRGASEKVPVYAALQGVTSGAAYVLHMDDQIGSIAPGKKADFVILAQNPLKVPPLQLKSSLHWAESCLRAGRLKLYFAPLFASEARATPPLNQRYSCDFSTRCQPREVRRFVIRSLVFASSRACDCDYDRVDGCDWSAPVAADRFGRGCVRRTVGELVFADTDAIRCLEVYVSWVEAV